VNIVCDNALVIGYALGKKRIGADVVNEAAADLLTMETRGVALESADAPTQVAVALPPRSRRLSQVGVIAVVVIALVIGLLSVGRSLLRRDAAGPERAAAPRAPLEVVQPGLRDEAAPRLARQDAPGSAGAPAGGARAPNAAADSVAPVVAHDPAPASDPPPPAVAAQSAPAPAANAPAAALSAPGAAAAAPQPMAPPVAAVPVAPAPAPPQSIVVASVPPAAQVAPAPIPVAQGIPPGPVPAAAKLPEAAPETADALRLVLPDYRRIQVRPGDSVSQIATSTYGQASATMLDLMKMANPSIRDIDIIAVGQELRLPQLDQGLAVLQEPDGQYALLVLSTPAENRAREIGRALRKHGFEARVGKADFGGGRVVWRVLIGDLSDRAAAQAVGKQLQRVVREDTRIAAMADRLETNER
jgi:hypothetical protein